MSSLIQVYQPAARLDGLSEAVLANGHTFTQEAPSGRSDADEPVHCSLQTGSVNLADPAWYCIRTHPKHEHIAAAHLRQLHRLDVFNPQLRLVRQTRRGRIWSTESVFPNYLFARFVLASHMEKIRYTPSVKSVLHFGGRVAPIPEVVIEELRHCLAETAGSVFTDTPLEGDEVEIARGPFEGLKGPVICVVPAKARVRILLEIMGRSVQAELSLKAVLFPKREAANVVLGGTHSVSGLRIVPGLC
jgi:transcriptional antiterminator RfaH